MMSRTPAVVLALSMLAAGCARANDEKTGAAKPPDQAAIVASAQSDYDYESPERGADTADDPDDLENDGVEAGSAPTMTIARATLKGSATGAPDSEVLARITSSAAYDKLGISAGVNYVWRDRRDPPKDDLTWKMYVVPADLTVKMEKWKRDGKKKAYTHGEPHQPRLVVASKDKATIAFGACLDDPVCGSGHCGYSSK